MATIDMTRPTHAERGNGGWSFLLFGAIIALMGAIASADLVLATVVATMALGMVMIVAALLQLAHALVVRRRSGALWWALSGLLYLAAGISVMVQPGFAAMLLTLFLAVSLGLSGVLRIALARGRLGMGRGGLMVSGLVSLGAAVLLVLGWPSNSAWVLGIVLAVDLLVQGIALMVVGLSLKAAA